MINKFKKNPGITLIALVVTIVVLLILAGISISMLTGQNGILNRATEAKEKTEKAQIDESDKMVQMEAMVQAAGKSIVIKDDKKINTESTTGKNKNDILNNIYDLYGCHREWTIEANNNNSRIYRGGSFEANIFPSYRDIMGPIALSNSTSSRATLYIK